MLQAIVTKFFVPTNVRGSRIKATAAAGYVWHSYDHSMSMENNHREAARKLAEKMEWAGNWIGGGSPDGSGYVFVTDAGQIDFSVKTRA